MARACPGVYYNPDASFGFGPSLAVPGHETARHTLREPGFASLGRSRDTIPLVAEPPVPSHLHSDPDDRLVFRRGKLRKREDDEVRMMREALANLTDVPRVKRLLLELGRFYNPVTNAPVLGAETRRGVVTLLEAGDPDGARAALETHLAEYLKLDDRQAAGPTG